MAFFPSRHANCSSQWSFAEGVGGGGGGVNNRHVKRYLETVCLRITLFASPLWYWPMGIGRIDQKGCLRFWHDKASLRPPTPLIQTWHCSDSVLKRHHHLLATPYSIMATPRTLRGANGTYNSSEGNGKGCSMVFCLGRKVSAVFLSREGEGSDAAPWEP